MLVNKEKLGCLVIVGVLFLSQCKEKATTETESAPTRSDYIIASNYTYLVATDSAAKISSRIIMDEAKFPITYDGAVKKRFDFIKSAEKGELEKSINFQVRYMLSQVVKDLYLESAGFMSVSPTDDPLDFVSRKIIMRKYLEPRTQEVQNIIANKVAESFDNSKTQSDWKLVNDLYKYYYPKDSFIEMDFSSMARTASYMYIKHANMQEDSIKRYYQNWDNKVAAKTMAYINKGR